MGNIFYRLAKDLKIEFPNLKGMSARNLRYMQKFDIEFDNDEFCNIMLQNYLGLQLQLL